jgi:hypothetical protein
VCFGVAQEPVEKESSDVLLADVEAS